MKNIQFNEEMFKAILTGQKTQTRRVIEPESGGEIIGWGGNGIAMEEIPSDETDTQYVRTVRCPLVELNEVVLANEQVEILITHIGVERLQDITESDCINEGIGSAITRDCKRPKFQQFWDSLYIDDSKKWISNPWVWVIKFQLKHAV